jgi:predicted amidohydrolase YtcJ
MGMPLVARAQQPGAADVVLRGGRVLTMAGTRVAEAVAVSGGRIAYVGSDGGVGPFIGPATEVIELRGRTLMPGIHDAHMHPLSGGLALTKPTLNYRKLDLKEFVDAIRKLLTRSADQEPDGWLSVDLWEPFGMDRQPTKEDLDRLPTRRPILVVDLNGHTAVANSRALELAGITRSTPDPSGGEIRRGRNREPTGILLDNAIGLVSRKIPPLTTAQNADALQAAHDEMAKRGVTSYMDASAGETELAALAALAERGPLTVRPSSAITVDPSLAAEPERMLASIERLRSAHARPGTTIRTVKMFFDGVIEHPTQTAALLQPYRVNRGTKRNPRWLPGKSRGPTYFRQAVANRAVARLDAAGWQVHVHAIGDRAVRSALDAFEHARRRRSGDNRHTICHLELIHPDDLRRFKRLGVLANMQLHWAERDSYTVDSLRPYIGDRRWRYTYPAGSLEEAGARLCGGSDWPVDPLLPFRQIEMAVNRTADEVYEGYPKPLFPQEGLSLRRSLVMHTRNSAFQLHQETLTGQIRQGLAADLIVLDRDILRVVEACLEDEGRDDDGRRQGRAPRGLTATRARARRGPPACCAGSPVAEGRTTRRPRAQAGPARARPRARSAWRAESD